MNRTVDFVNCSTPNIYTNSVRGYFKRYTILVAASSQWVGVVFDCEQCAWRDTKWPLCLSWICDVVTKVRGCVTECQLEVFNISVEGRQFFCPVEIYKIRKLPERLAIRFFGKFVQPPCPKQYSFFHSMHCTSTRLFLLLTQTLKTWLMFKHDLGTKPRTWQRKPGIWKHQQLRYGQWVNYVIKQSSLVDQGK